MLFTLAVLAAFPLVRLRRPIAASGALAAALLLSLANNAFGDGLANALVYRHGMTGEATTVAPVIAKASAGRKGAAPILAYDVIIATPDGRTVHSRFRDGDRILYRRSGENGAAHPAQVGDVFDVRYLADDPNAFVIVADDRSAAAGARRCATLAQNVRRVSRTLAADRARPDARPDYVAAIEAYLAGDCGGEGRDLQGLRQTLAAADDAGGWPRREATSR